MTTLIAWKGYDGNGISSVYLASDSRFTWGNTMSCDCGQKIFASKKSPELIGYCGDALFATNIINTLTYLIDEEVIYSRDSSASEKNLAVYSYIVEKFSNYPKVMDTTLIHIIKEERRSFSYYEMKYSHNNKVWSNNEVSLDDKSSLINAYGSGKDSYMRRLSSYINADLVNTSRFFYMVLCEVLAEGLDSCSGGSPQLSVLYSGNKSHQAIGVIWNNSRFLNGIRIDNDYDNKKIEWFNESFERYKHDEMNLVDGAQRQPWPKNMKKLPWL